VVPSGRAATFNVNPPLLQLIHRGRQWWQELQTDPGLTLEAIGRREGLTRGRSCAERSLGLSWLIFNHPVDNQAQLRSFNRMVDNRLDATFSALADPTRRGMLAALTLGEKPVSELAEPYRMTFAGAAKHVEVLARAGLIERRKVGRQQLCRLKASRLKEASDWLAQWERFWTLEAELKRDPA
jgi:DNA-binding transcriptional ArsR family regulator